MHLFIQFKLIKHVHELKEGCEYEHCKKQQKVVYEKCVDGVTDHRCKQHLQVVNI